MSGLRGLVARDSGALGLKSFSGGNGGVGDWDRIAPARAFLYLSSQTRLLFCQQYGFITFLSLLLGLLLLLLLLLLGRSRRGQRGLPLLHPPRC